MTPSSLPTSIKETEKDSTSSAIDTFIKNMNKKTIALSTEQNKIISVTTEQNVPIEDYGIATTIEKGNTDIISDATDNYIFIVNDDKINDDPIVNDETNKLSISNNGNEKLSVFITEEALEKSIDSRLERKIQPRSSGSPEILDKTARNDIHHEHIHIHKPLPINPHSKQHIVTNRVKPFRTLVKRRPLVQQATAENTLVPAAVRPATEPLAAASGFKPGKLETGFIPSTFFLDLFGNNGESNENSQISQATRNTDGIPKELNSQPKQTETNNQETDTTINHVDCQCVQPQNCQDDVEAQDPRDIIHLLQPRKRPSNILSLELDSADGQKIVKELPNLELVFNGDDKTLLKDSVLLSLDSGNTKDIFDVSLATKLLTRVKRSKLSDIIAQARPLSRVSIIFVYH